MPVMFPKCLPDDWKGAFVMLIMVFVSSSFLDNIAAAFIGGAMAPTIAGQNCTELSVTRLRG